MRMSPGVKEQLLHFDNGFSTEVMDYATNTALSHSKYMIVRTEKKQQFGYCTHCNTESPTHLPKLSKSELTDLEICGCPAAMYTDEEYKKKKHGDKIICPNCKSECIVRYSGLGHSKLKDHAYFVYYEKSRLNPKMIVARCISASRNYSKGYKNIKTGLSTEVYYTFEYKKMGKMIKTIYSSWRDPGHLGFSRTVYSMDNHHPYTYFTYSRESIKEAVKGTPFAWSGWESYDYKDMTEYFDLFARYPVIEYLNKLGHKAIVTEKLETRSIAHGAINWHGKSIESIFRLTKEEYGIIKQQKIKITSKFLNINKINRDRNLGLIIPEIEILSEHIISDDEIVNILKTFTQDMSFREAFKYCCKQAKKCPSYHYFYNIASDWRDYIAECKKLNIDTTEMQTRFPNDLHKAHQNTTAQIRYAADKALTEKIIARLPKLSRFYVKSDKFIIRPAESAFEIVDEGKVLNHCVGRYAEAHAEGRTCILFIRKAEEPDKPFYTVEVNEGKIIQVRGLKNCSVNDEALLEFLEVFKRKALSNKSAQKTKTKIPA